MIERGPTSAVGRVDRSASLKQKVGDPNPPFPARPDETRESIAVTGFGRHTLGEIISDEWDIARAAGVEVFLTGAVQAFHPPDMNICINWPTTGQLRRRRDSTPTGRPKGDAAPQEAGPHRHRGAKRRYLGGSVPSRNHPEVHRRVARRPR